MEFLKLFEMANKGELFYAAVRSTTCTLGSDFGLELSPKLVYLDAVFNGPERTRQSFMSTTTIAALCQMQALPPQA